MLIIIDEIKTILNIFQNKWYADKYECFEIYSGINLKTEEFIPKILNSNTVVNKELTMAYTPSSLAP